MAQKHAGLPNETVFVECRAFVFYHQAGQNRWIEVGEPNVYSRIQLLCNRQDGSTGLYRIFGRLESSGMVSIMTDRLPFKARLSLILVAFSRKVVPSKLTSQILQRFLWNRD